ncbi:MAG: DUF423 domain-containing protein [Saprospiraceae bacterium]
MNNYQNKYTGTAALLIAVSIVFGAFGAHILIPGLEDKYIHTLSTANQYFFTNALGLLVVSILGIEIRRIKLTYILILLGLICFSGSLYVIVLCKFTSTNIPSIVGPLTPIGGIFLILGWLNLAFYYLCLRR